MANTNSPFGFQQVSGTGTTPSYEQVLGLTAYNSSNSIFFGDVVAHDATGFIIQQPTGQTTPIAGIFTGCSYISTSQKKRVWSNYWGAADVASTNSPLESYFINDPNSQWLVQCTGGSGATQANVGSTADFNPGTGSTSNGISGGYLIATFSTSSATNAFRLMSLTTPVGNTSGTLGNYNQVIVQFANAETRTPTGA